MKKLILEELEDEELTTEVPNTAYPADLTPEAKKSFHVSSIIELLDLYFETYNTLNSYLTDPAFDNDNIKAIFESISEDNAIIIGKLQEALKSADYEKEDLINQGAEDAQEIIIEPTKDTKE